jgi:hypothetical protein
MKLSDLEGAAGLEETQKGQIYLSPESANLLLTEISRACGPNFVAKHADLSQLLVGDRSPVVPIT